nr:reticulocyte-binding protein 2 homolog a-like [Onthophagus taurus]
MFKPILETMLNEIKLLNDISDDSKVIERYERLSKMMKQFKTSIQEIMIDQLSERRDIKVIEAIKQPLTTLETNIETLKASIQDVAEKPFSTTMGLVESIAEIKEVLLEVEEVIITTGKIEDISLENMEVVKYLDEPLQKLSIAIGNIKIVEQKPVIKDLDKAMILKTVGALKTSIEMVIQKVEVQHFEVIIKKLEPLKATIEQFEDVIKEDMGVRKDDVFTTNMLKITEEILKELEKIYEKIKISNPIDRVVYKIVLELDKPIKSIEENVKFVREIIENHVVDDINETSFAILKSIDNNLLELIGSLTELNNISETSIQNVSNKLKNLIPNLELVTSLPLDTICLEFLNSSFVELKRSSINVVNNLKQVPVILEVSSILNQTKNNLIEIQQSYQSLSPVLERLSVFKDLMLISRELEGINLIIDEFLDNTFILENFSKENISNMTEINSILIDLKLVNQNILNISQFDDSKINDEVNKIIEQLDNIEVRLNKFVTQPRMIDELKLNVSNIDKILLGVKNKSKDNHEIKQIQSDLSVLFENLIQSSEEDLILKPSKEILEIIKKMSSKELFVKLIELQEPIKKFIETKNYNSLRQSINNCVFGDDLLKLDKSKLIQNNLKNLSESLSQIINKTIQENVENKISNILLGLEKLFLTSKLMATSFESAKINLPLLGLEDVVNPINSIHTTIGLIQEKLKTDKNISENLSEKLLRLQTGMNYLATAMKSSVELLNENVVSVSQLIPALEKYNNEINEIIKSESKSEIINFLGDLEMNVKDLCDKLKLVDSRQSKLEEIQPIIKSGLCLEETTKDVIAKDLENQRLFNLIKNLNAPLKDFNKFTKEDLDLLDNKDIKNLSSLIEPVLKLSEFIKTSSSTLNRDELLLKIVALKSAISPITRSSKFPKKLCLERLREELEEIEKELINFNTVIKPIKELANLVENIQNNLQKSTQDMPSPQKAIKIENLVEPLKELKSNLVNLEEILYEEIVPIEEINKIESIKSTIEELSNEKLTEMPQTIKVLNHLKQSIEKVKFTSNEQHLQKVEGSLQKLSATISEIQSEHKKEILKTEPLKLDIQQLKDSCEKLSKIENIQVESQKVVLSVIGLEKQLKTLHEAVKQLEDVYDKEEIDDIFHDVLTKVNLMDEPIKKFNLFILSSISPAEGVGVLKIDKPSLGKAVSSLKEELSKSKLTEIETKKLKFIDVAIEVLNAQLSEIEDVCKEEIELKRVGEDEIKDVKAQEEKIEIVSEEIKTEEDKSKEDKIGELSKEVDKEEEKLITQQSLGEEIEADSKDEVKNAAEEAKMEEDKRKEDEIAEPSKEIAKEEEKLLSQVSEEKIEVAAKDEVKEAPEEAKAEEVKPKEEKLEEPTKEVVKEEEKVVLQQVSEEKVEAVSKDEEKQVQEEAKIEEDKRKEEKIKEPPKEIAKEEEKLPSQVSEEKIEVVAKDEVKKTPEEAKTEEVKPKEEKLEEPTKEIVKEEEKIGTQQVSEEKIETVSKDEEKKTQEEAKTEEDKPKEDKIKKPSKQMK